MSHKTYLQEVNKIRKSIYGTPFEDIQNLGLLGTFSLVSANILRFLDRKYEEHYKLIQDIQFHRALSALDQYFPHKLQQLKVKDNTGAVTSKSEKGHIFVTFHTGSYRLFIQHLNLSALPFCLVTEGKYIEEQGAQTQILFKQLNAENKDLEILEAENPRLLFELMKRINTGISVVFFIDGNTGVSEKKLEENKNLLKIDFLNHNIYARQGISMLAYLSKAQVILALVKRNKNLSDRISFRKLNTKKYEKYNRNDYANALTKSLFEALEGFLKKYPEQWEGWFYIQKFFEQEVPEALSNHAVIEKFLGGGEIVLGVSKYLQLVKYDEDNVFVITKKDYQIMKITPFLYDVLLYFQTPKSITANNDVIVNEQAVGWEFVEELIEMDFLSA